ncbi:MAG: signal peptidase I [Dehalococcoidia bacterium]|nr:signal peptidase I [Dehalococcoidia bacterium]
MLLALVVVRWFRRAFVAVEVAGESMTPALLPGEYLLLRRARLPEGETVFGRIVATRDRSGRLLLKRVIGLPGESLRVGAEVQVNGRVLIEPYANGESAVARYRGVQRLGAGEHFLLGDHRDASTDSRDFGAVHHSRIEGVAVYRYWPLGRGGRLRRPRRRFAAAE